MADKFTEFEVFTDRYGKDHKVYSAMIMLKKDIQRLTPKFSDINIMANLLNPKVEDGVVVLEDNGDIVFDDSAYEAMMQVIEYALDGKETREEILKWIDASLVRQIIDVFYDMSGYKKKQAQTI